MSDNDRDSPNSDEVIGGKDNDDDNEDDEDDEDDEQSVKEEATEKKDESWFHWSDIINETLEQMESVPDDGTKLLQEPQLGEFLDALHENLEKRSNFIEYMENTDTTYRQITRHCKSV